MARSSFARGFVRKFSLRSSSCIEGVLSGFVGEARRVGRGRQRVSIRYRRFMRLLASGSTFQTRDPVCQGEATFFLAKFRAFSL